MMVSVAWCKRLQFGGSGTAAVGVLKQRFAALGSESEAPFNRTVAVWACDEHVRRGIVDHMQRQAPRIIEHQLKLNFVQQAIVNAVIAARCRFHPLVDRATLFPFRLSKPFRRGARLITGIDPKSEMTASAAIELDSDVTKNAAERTHLYSFI